MSWNKEKAPRRDEFYDVNSARATLMVLGGYSIVQKPKTLRILNILFLIFISLLFLYIFIMSFATISLANDRVTNAHSAYTLGAMVGSCGVILSKHFALNSLNEASKSLRKGIFCYNERFDDEYLYIRKKRIQLVNFILSVVAKSFFGCAVLYIFIIPLMKFLILNPDEQSTNKFDNPFLPLPHHVPFDTHNPLGFSLAFLADAVSLTFMYASFACHNETYIGIALQFAGELEVLNYSLQHIEKRAHLELSKKDDSRNQEGDYNMRLSEQKRLEEILYYCLKRNVLHHHAILRFKKEITPYLGASNSVEISIFSVLTALVIFMSIEDPTGNIILTITLVSTMFSYFPFCWFGQMIADTSTETMMAFYSTPWPSCNEKFTDMLKIIMINTLKPIFLRDKFFNINASLETFGELMSGSYKLFNIFR